jgi:hypothetical protein
MTYAEMVFDAGIDLFFFTFGLVAGAFVFWLETR